MTTPQTRTVRHRGAGSFIGGLLTGVVITGLLIVFVGMPFAIGHRNDLPLERLYGDMAITLSLKTQGIEEAANPLAASSRALETGRIAYTGSCAVCHGVAGDGKGSFGQALYPPASDLRGHDTQEKSDAELYWIVKNGLSFLGMPGYGDRYDDARIWSLVAYMRSLPKEGARGAEVVPPPTDQQLAVANPAGDAESRGAAVYFAQGCSLCHGAVGNAPGSLRLGGAGGGAERTIRQGDRGMPAFDKQKISDEDLKNLITYLRSFPSRRRG